MPREVKEKKDEEQKMKIKVKPQCRARVMSKPFGKIPRGVLVGGEVSPVIQEVEGWALLDLSQNPRFSSNAFVEINDSVNLYR